MRLSLRLVSRHRALYAGCLVTLSATTVIAASQAALVEGLSRPENVHVPGLSAEELSSQLTALRGLLSVLSGLTIVMGGVLMWTSVKQVVAVRQQELALMRLAGASRGRLGSMVSLECLVIGLVAGCPAAMVGASLAGPLFAGLKAIGFFGRNVEAQFGFAVGAALTVTGVTAGTTGFAGMLASLSATRGEVVPATSAMAPRMSAASILGRIAVAIVGFGGLMCVDAKTLGPNLVLALPLAAVVPLLALAPLLIPAGAWVVGRCVGIVAPGAGRLAARRASKDRVRYARMATPLIVSVGVLGGFLVANAPDEQLRAETYRSRVAASVVASVVGVADADRAAGAVGGQTNVVARLASAKRAVSGNPQVLYFTDAVALGTLLRQSVVAGNQAAVAGLDVASSVSGTHVGDALSVLDRQGQVVIVHVVAVVNDPLFEGVFFDWEQASRILPDVTAIPVQILASPITQSEAVAALQSAGAQGAVVDRDGYIQQLEDARKANTYRSNIGIFGTIYLMSVISLIQTAMSGAWARRGEFRVLRSLGVGRRGILMTVATETIIISLVAGALVTTVLVGLGLRFASINGTSARTAIESVSWVTAASFVSVALIGLLATLVATFRSADWGA